ncbi:MAG TPA: DMT family transporter [Jatrophihabitantaceae bacterium]|nr:DMT family transporter [Jatrophihabitantaceae bacterium]
MPLPVVAVVLLAAFLHAAWNAVAHAIADRLIGFALIGAAATAGGAVLTLVVGAPAPASWPYLAVSAALHVGYSLLLLRSYELGEFGQAYPLARGTSPWLVAIGAAAFAHETLTPPRLAGVAVISVGLASLVFAGRLTRADVPAIGAALLTGVTIAAYTTVDGLGVRHAGGALGYAAWLFIAEGAVIPLMAVAARREKFWAHACPHLAAGLAGGVASIIAYGLVLWAQTRGALAPIAALRETSVIIGAIIGALVFRERFGRWRIVATVLVAGGVALINV